MKDPHLQMLGRVMALEQIISIIIDHGDDAKRQLLLIDQGKLEDFSLTLPQSDTTIESYCEVIKEMQKRHQTQRSNQ